MERRLPGAGAMSTILLWSVLFVGSAGAIDAVRVPPVAPAVAAPHVMATATASATVAPAASATPAAPAAAPVAERDPAPLRKLRSGRPWPQFHYSRLPAKVAPAADAAPSTQRRVRGFWRAR